MVEPADFSDTLDSLASFGSSIGATVAATYKSINTSTVPRTGIPQSTQVAPAAKTSNINVTEIAILLVVGVGLALGIRALTRR